MTLEQIKNDYAVSIGYDDWKSMLTEIFQFSVDEIIEHENEVMILAQKECLKRASENANLNKYSCDSFGHRYHDCNIDGVSLENGSLYEINKESITNENNIIK